MSSGGYPLDRAAADLAAQGLLAGCLVGKGTGWGLMSSKAPLTGVGKFRGATLDSRQVAPEQLFVALAGTQVDGRDYIATALKKGASAALTRAWTTSGDDPLPGQAAPRDSGAVILLSEDPVAALACLATCWRRQHRRLRLVAVTGSNGKTTTKDFLAAAFAAAGPSLATAGNYNNELGLPVTVLGLCAEHSYAVVEIGASAVGEIARLAAVAQPTVGVITNAAEAHLAQFGSLDGVIRGKGELLAALPADGRAVLNADSPGFDYWTARAPCPVVSFGREAGDCRWSWRAAVDRDGGALELDNRRWQVPLPGEHNGANLVAAILAARAVGLSDEVVAKGLARFAPSPHRSQLLDISGIKVLDDCYNANPTSVQHAVAALVAHGGGGGTVAVLGHMAELGIESEELHSHTGRQLRALGLERLLSVGEGAVALSEGFRAVGGVAHHCPDKEAAVAWLLANVAPGERVLVKGSRAAGMEECIALWRDHLALAGEDG